MPKSRTFIFREESSFNVFIFPLLVIYCQPLRKVLLYVVTKIYCLIWHQKNSVQVLALLLTSCGNSLALASHFSHPAVSCLERRRLAPAHQGSFIHSFLCIRLLTGYVAGTVISARNAKWGMALAVMEFTFQWGRQSSNHINEYVIPNWLHSLSINSMALLENIAGELA